MFLARLPDRAVQGDGQGGGDALSIAELVEVFKIDTDDPVLMKLSMIQTDSAKAYRRTGLLRWPAPVALHSEFEEDTQFTIHMYTAYQRDP